MCGERLNADTGSMVTINGIRTDFCTPCEDDLLVKLARRRFIGIRLGDGGEVVKLDVSAHVDMIPNVIKLPRGYKITSHTT